jgi:hypothetical protein
MSDSNRQLRRAIRLAFGTIMGIVIGVFVVKLLDRIDVGESYGVRSFAGKMWVILSEGIMGFGIAISGLRLAWPLHGGLLGLVFSIPLSVWLLRIYSATTYGSNGARVFTLMLVLGVIFGVLIELVLSGLLKARSFSSESHEPDSRPAAPESTLKL